MYVSYLNSASGRILSVEEGISKHIFDGIHVIPKDKYALNLKRYKSLEKQKRKGVGAQRYKGHAERGPIARLCCILRLVIQDEIRDSSSELCSWTLALVPVQSYRGNPKRPTPT
jgi:hypothetical protein